RPGPGDHDLVALIQQVRHLRPLRVRDDQVSTGAEGPGIGAAEQHQSLRLGAEGLQEGADHASIQRVTPIRAGEQQPKVTGRGALHHDVRMRHAQLHKKATGPSEGHRPRLVTYGIPNRGTANVAGAATRSTETCSTKTCSTERTPVKPAPFPY